MMPPEGPNKTEELLQRYAKKRRDQGGDFSLHPATRRLLQGEVSRQFGSSTRKRTSLFSWFRSEPSRVWFGVAAASLIIVSTWMIRRPAQTERTFQLAQNASNHEETEPANAQPNEVGKQMVSSDTRLALNDSQEGLRSKEKAANDLQKGSENLIPAQNLSAVKGPVDYYFRARSGISLTNNAAFNIAGLGEENRGAARDSTQVQLSYSLNGTADERGFGSLGPSARVSEAELDLTRQVGRIATSGVMLADGGVYNKNPEALALPTSDVASPDAKRFSEVDQLQLRVEPPARTESFGLNPIPSGRQEDLARNRAVNSPSIPAESGTVATRESPAASLGAAAAAVPAAPAVITAAKAATGMLATPLPTYARTDFSDAPVFYRQNDLGGLPQVAQKTDVLQKKAEVSSSVLSRFTIEERGGNVRIMDTDGSVYEGPISDEFGRAEEEKLIETGDKDGLTREARRGVKSFGANARFFRAAGSNVTLRQNVVVNGQISGGEVPVAQIGRGAGDSRGAIVGGASPVAPNRPATQPSPRRSTVPGAAGRSAVAGVTNAISAIEGTVLIGATNEQRFRAVRGPR